MREARGEKRVTSLFGIDGSVGSGGLFAEGRAILEGTPLTRESYTSAMRSVGKSETIRAINSWLAAFPEVRKTTKAFRERKAAIDARKTRRRLETIAIIAAMSKA